MGCSQQKKENTKALLRPKMEEAEMNETFNVFDPPASDKHYGFVVGRIIRRIGDSTLDPDAYPDAANVEGVVRFTPMEKVVKSENYRAIVFREPIDAPLDDRGFITNTSMGARGIWLTVGFWEVSFLLKNQTLTPFYIEVLETYDEGNPLDLANAQPEVLPSSTPRNVISLPSGGADGDILVKNADGTTRWEHYLLDGVTLEDLRGPMGPEGPVGPVGPSGPAGQLNLSENMLLNGGFELGNLDYWWSGGTLQTTDVPGKDGANRAVTWPAGEKNHGDQTFPTVPVGPAGIYKIDVWLKADTPDSNFYLDLQDQSGQQVFTSKTVGGEENPYVLQEETLPTSWTKYTRYIRFGDTSLAQANKNAMVMKIAGMHLNHLSGANQNAVVSMGGIWIRPVQQVVPSPASIGDTELKDNSITLAKMADASVGTDELVNNSVTLEKLLNGSVDTDKLVDKSVTTNKIADDAIGTHQIAPKAITKDLLADSIPLGGTMPWYNVKDYGAKGNKSTDDSAAIQSAIDAAPINGVIFFPTGWYIVNTTLTMKKGQVLYGLSRRHMNAAVSYGPVIRTTMPDVVAVSMDAGTVEGINFYGPGETGYGIAASKGTVAIKMVGSGKIKDVAIYGFSLGIDASQCWYGHVEHSYIRCCDLAIQSTRCYNLKLYNIRIHGLFYDGTRGDGIDLRDRTMMSIHGGSIEHVKIGAMFNGGSQSLEADDVYFETAHAGAVAYAFNYGASHLSVTNNQVYMDYVLRFVTMASTASAGSSLYASGNKFKATSESTLAGGAVCYGLSSLVDSAVILSDDWVDMKGFSKYKYATSTPSNKLIVAPTAVKATIT